MDELEGFQRKVSLERKELERIFTGKKKKRKIKNVFYVVWWCFRWEKNNILEKPEGSK